MEYLNWYCALIKLILKKIPTGGWNYAPLHHMFAYQCLKQSPFLIIVRLLTF